MGTNCVPVVADLFLFCYERGFMMFLSVDKQADTIDAFNTTSRYFPRGGGTLIFSYKHRLGYFF